MVRTGSIAHSSRPMSTHIARAVVITLATFGAATGSVSAARADDSASAVIRTLVIESHGEGASNSSLKLSFDAPIDTVGAARALASIGADPASLVVSGSNASAVTETVMTAKSMPSSVPVVRQPQQLNALTSGPSGGVNLRCNYYYRWSDGNGTFTLQHACGGTTAPWSFKISSALQAIAASTVRESGMAWSKNGVSMPRQAPHVVAANYLFHGTYDPAPDGSHILYQDTFSFRHNVGGGGDALVSINGDFRLTAIRPCGNGGPC